jgi:DNA repair exonuclease SbcCD ATPase subunit
MDDHDSRLAVAEEKLRQHDRLHEEIQQAIRQMAEGISKLAESEVRREQDSNTFARLFKAVDKMQTEISQLRDSFKTYEATQVKKELAAYKSAFLKFVGYGMTIVASMALGHYGIRFIG